MPGFMWEILIAASWGHRGRPVAKETNLGCVAGIWNLTACTKLVALGMERYVIDQRSSIKIIQEELTEPGG